MGRYGHNPSVTASALAGREFASAHAILSRPRNSVGKKKSAPAPRGIPVESSLLRSVAWRDGLLYVRFDNDAALGKLFVYQDVPESVLKKLMAAKSQGSWFYQNIRDSYSYEVRERKK